MTATPEIEVSETPFQLLYSDLEAELNTTRRILEQVPNGKNEWRPHAKSMTLGDLASHVAQLPGFGLMMLTEKESDVSTRPREPKAPDTAARLKTFDELSGKFRAQLEKMTWDEAKSNWTLRAGQHVVAVTPRGKALRNMVITHIAHHRAQLGVYLRLLDVPVPSTYGPTADYPFPTR